MKFAFSSNAFLRFDLLEAIRIVSEAGYQGIEIMADAPHAYPLHLNRDRIREIRRALEQSNLRISNVNAFMHCADGDTYHPSWIEKDPAQRSRRVDYTLRCIDLAQQLGATNISTEPGGPLEGLSRAEGMDLFREGLSAVEEPARQAGIRILIEPEPGLLIETSSQFLELFQELDQAVFGLNFDVGHFFCVREDPCELIRSLEGVYHHFHLEDIAATREHHHLQLGTGAIDLPAVLSTIRDIAYEGFVTVELYTYEDRAVDATLDAFRFLTRWLPSDLVR